MLQCEREEATEATEPRGPFGFLMGKGKATGLSTNDQDKGDGPYLFF